MLDMQPATGVTRPTDAFATTPQPLQIKEIIEENYRVKRFIFDGEMPTGKPGQFIMAWLPRLNEKPFSLVNHQPVTLTIAAVGPFSKAMHALKVGDTVWFRGPFGQPFEIRGQRPLLVGGGYRLSPLVWLAQEQLARQLKPVAVIGAATAADLIAVERFKALGVPVFTITNDGSQGEKGLPTAPIKRMLAAQEVDTICAMGPHGMLHALEALAEEHHVAAQLSWEAYMGCAIGLCGMCEHVDGSLLCVEGPVRVK